MNGPAPKESTIVAAILKYLNGLPRCTADKVHGGGYSGKKTVDISGCLDGRALALEVKRVGNEATAMQEYTLARWAAAGAVTGVVRSVDDVRGVLRDHCIYLD